MLLELLNRRGFAGRYDFVYLPHCFQTHVSLGYAFVNFATHADACLAHGRFAGFNAWCIPSGKVCEAAWCNSDQQGLRANVERYRNSSVMHPSVKEEFRPVKLLEGKLVRFPPPTRKVWPPHANFGVRARAKAHSA
uniref:Mei2-like C-terminal RNA recognition motif domain-containing protein n=1 Tax=Zooxanthella nutricula TaxID=1333877 RepID=A0A7S2K6Y0_9DINO